MLSALFNYQIPRFVKLVYNSYFTHNTFICQAFFLNLFFVCFLFLLSCCNLFTILIIRTMFLYVNIFFYKYIVLKLSYLRGLFLKGTNIKGTINNVLKIDV